MKKYWTIFLPIFLFTAVLMAQNETLVPKQEVVQKVPKTATSVELGIESITKNKDGSYQLAMYMLNAEPVAGYQMDFLPEGIMQPITMRGGISGELGYMMQASENGKVLGFSMQGTAIPIASSDKLPNNILYYLDVTFDGKPGQELTISFDSVVAGNKGTKLESVNIPFKFTLQ
ncbi:MAG: hypothetical protein HQ510_08570 [Candidatus Marinimicrobia bacterium]|nr:hypothetical protein [Candidatus Neomarinimicrobiota bacterium]